MPAKKTAAKKKTASSKKVPPPTSVVIRTHRHEAPACPSGHPRYCRRQGTEIACFWSPYLQKWVCVHISPR
jgi:hypothetical protein